MTQRQTFGISRVTFRDFETQEIQTSILRPASITLPVSQREHVDTNGGLANLPSATRLARSDGVFTVGTNECFAELEAMMTGATLTSNAASAVPQISSINDITGSLSTSLNVALEATAVVGTTVNIKMTAASTATVTLNPETGNQRVLVGINIPTSGGVEIASNTGIILTRAAVAPAKPAFNVGDESDFSILPAAAGGTDRVEYGVNDHPKYVSVRAYSVSRGQDDYVKVIDIYKAMPGGLPLGMTDNEATNGVELNFKAVDPQRTDGKWAVTFGPQEILMDKGLTLDSRLAPPFELKIKALEGVLAAHRFQLNQYTVADENFFVDLVDGESVESPFHQPILTMAVALRQMPQDQIEQFCRLWDVEASCL